MGVNTYERVIVLAALESDEFGEEIEREIEHKDSMQ